MPDTIAMARPGTMVSIEGVSLSWPTNPDGSPGTRQVLSLPPEKRPYRIQQRIVQGAIEEVDQEPNTKAGDGQLSTGHRLMTGEEAARHMAIPAPTPIRMVFDPVTGRQVERPFRIGVAKDPDGQTVEEREAADAARTKLQVDAETAADKEAARRARTESEAKAESDAEAQEKAAEEEEESDQKGSGARSIRRDADTADTVAGNAKVTPVSAPPETGPADTPSEARGKQKH